MSCSFIFKLKDKVALILYFSFCQQRPWKYQNRQCLSFFFFFLELIFYSLVCLLGLSVTICLRAMCLSSVFLVFPPSLLSLVFVCVFSLYCLCGMGVATSFQLLDFHGTSADHYLIKVLRYINPGSVLSLRRFVIYSGCYIHWPSSSLCSLFLLVLSLFYRGLFHKT